MKSMQTRRAKKLLLMSVLATFSCTSIQQKMYSSYDDYPVYEGQWEEMVYSPAATRFSLWAPTAQEVRVLLYDEGRNGSAYETVVMTAGKDGMWKTDVDGDLKGKFYAFNVKVDDCLTTFV